MATRASTSRATSPPAMPSSRWLLLFRPPAARHDRAAVGARNLRAAHAVRAFSARGLPARDDDRARRERLRRPAGSGQRGRRPQLDLPFDVLALLVGSLKIQERMRVLEQEPRHGALDFDFL